MNKQRLDQAVVARGLTATRSQAESWIRLGKVFVNGQVMTKPGHFVNPADNIELKASEQYVSRAALKLASVAKKLQLDFKDKVVLDVGSSTGGFTDYALHHGARKVIAVEAGTDQLHPSLRGHKNIELHEQLDVRQLTLDDRAAAKNPNLQRLSSIPNIVLIDVSFISLRDILPHIATLISKQADVVAMVKPQFEAKQPDLKHKGVLKNDRIRREVLKNFEAWVRQYFAILDKSDSEVAGSKGNVERFYMLQKHG